MGRPPAKSRGSRARPPLLAALLLGCLLVWAGSAQGAIYSWAGTWDTTYGTMQLTQTDAHVTGTYDHPAGSTIDGTVAGAQLIGTWAEGEFQMGTFEFVMSDDGTTFAGTWLGDQSGGGVWSGTRTSPVPPPIQDPPLDTNLEVPDPGPDSGLAKLIRRFEDQIEAAMKLPLWRPRGRQIWPLADEFQAKLKQIRPRNAAESRAKACALDAGFHWEYYGRQLINRSKANSKKKKKRYENAAAEHLRIAKAKLRCGIAYLPTRPDPDPPPTRAQGDSATINAFYPRDVQTGLTPNAVVFAGGTMTNCFASNTVVVVFSFDIVAGTRLTATWRLPNGRSTSNDEQGPLAETMKFPLAYTNHSPLPSGRYTFELRTQHELLAKASFTRACA